MELAQFGEALAYEAAFSMQALDDPEYPIDDLGEISLDVSRKLRALAIIALLVNADSDNFYHNLMRSGLVRLRFLNRLKSEGIESHHELASARYHPLLDAVAAGDMSSANEIVALSPSDWQIGREYEDDYCYAQILHRLVLKTPMPEEALRFLERFKAFLDGEPSARLGVCLALTKHDQSGFDEAFDALIYEQERRIAENKARTQLEDPEVIALRLVFVEGLAVLRLAEKQGLETQKEYKYCPSLARVPMSKPFPGE